jgi:ABC-type multidrug transport system ATPase subunit
MSSSPPAPKKPSAAVPALSTHGLTKDYGDRPALEPLDLSVSQGQHVALVGHNGSGKTTLLRMAAGLLDPSDGEARIMGRKAGSTEARRALSWLSDSPTFYDDLSLWEHLEYVARLHGVAEWHDRAEDLLTRLDLSGRRDDIPTTFSRGLRQKAAIALGMVRPFTVLLVDEPFVGLDANGKTTLLELLDEAAEGGATLLVATHELSFVNKVSRLLALRDGAMVYDGPPTDADVHTLVLPA